MNASGETSSSPSGRIRQAVSASLGCEPRHTQRGLEWGPRLEPGIRSAILRPASGGIHELDVVLAYPCETARFSVHRLWELAAALIKESDLTVIPVSPTQGAADGKWPITARLSLRDTVLDLPRLNRLSLALELLDSSAKTLQAELPFATGQAPEVPAQLKGTIEPLTAQVKQDSNLGNVCRATVPLLQAGLSVAMVGAPLRTRLELDRLARIAANVVVLRKVVPIQDLPQIARIVKGASLTLAAPCWLLRPRMSVYEQGRELDGTLEELAADGLPVLTSGTRDELEAVFGVGQGRSYSPLLPVIQALPPAEDADLVRVAFAERCGGLACGEADRLVKLVLQAVDLRAPGECHLLQPLSNLAAERGPGDPDLPAALARLADDLVGRRDTFGTCEEAPATPRPPDVGRHLRQRLGEADLENLLRSRILGQNEALSELAKRVWQEAICRPCEEPLRLMLAGPVGTGKSVAAKYIAEVLGWPCHYIDATAFDSEHAVMTSLAGASPGIVNSYNDGVLAKISRRPSVVEVADLDHAQPGVRGALCELFLRILQEGTLQTGSGMIIRTLPSVIFVFTSNVAYGTRKANTRFGFGKLTREEVRQRVVSHALEHLGHAFISRVGEPVLFDEFTRHTAIALVEMEIRSLVVRVCGSRTTAISPNVAEQLIDSLPTLETGARGIIDATRSALADALRDHADMRAEHVAVRLVGHRIVVEAACEQHHSEPSITETEQASAVPQSP